ncbi:hypothetical protein [Streptomyces coffeae]|uniref:Uncharacterized protein n=1 Tax=Streptomyces coffeae TaxID=621382 RepID=A0ABS1N9T4_9ACTN|nr:hypothetical protein [Streptomyces coffeae]MBL1096828.1 hypothetical protein [Streptomyces coffeae]
MRQCTATAEVPLTELLIAILAGQKRVTDSDLAYAPDTVRCELGVWHEDGHAAFVWDWEKHKPREGLWARWTPDGTMRFESLTWCGIPGSPDGDDACTLYLDHAREHSWKVRDPELEAFSRRVFAENAGLIARLTRKRN